MLATLALILEKQQADVELRATPSARFPDGEWKKVYDSVGQIPGCDQEFFTNIHLTFKANGFWNSLFSPTQGMQEDERSSLLSSFKTGTLNRKVGRSLTTFQNRLLMCSLSLQRPLWSLFEAMLKKLTIVMDRKHDRDIRDYGLSQEQGVVIESTTNVGWSSITSASCKVSRIQVWTKGKRKPEKYSIVWGHLLPLWKILIDIVTDLASYDEKRKIKTIRANVVRIHADDPTVPPSFIGVVIPNS